MMLARQFVYMARGGCIGDIEARLREGVGRPDIGEGATTAMRDPQAGELPVPTPMRIRIGGQIGAVRVHPLAVGAVGSVAAEKTHVLHEGTLAGHPLGAHRTVVDATGVKTDAGHNVVSPARGFEERTGRRVPHLGWNELEVRPGS